jgi:hypothetical protein
LRKSRGRSLCTRSEMLSAPGLKPAERYAIRYQPGPLPAPPGEPDLRYARTGCVRAAIPTPAFVARDAPAPHQIFSAHRGLLPRRFDRRTIAALQRICSPSHVPCNYRTSSKGHPHPKIRLGSPLRSHNASSLSLWCGGAGNAPGVEGVRRNYESLANSILRN